MTYLKRTQKAKVEKKIEVKINFDFNFFFFFSSENKSYSKMQKPPRNHISMGVVCGQTSQTDTTSPVNFKGVNRR